MNIPASQVLGAVKSALLANGYRFTHLDEAYTIDLTFGGTKFVIDMTIFCGDGYLTCVARLPMIVSVVVRSNVIATLNRLSYGTPCGGYELAEHNGRCQAKYGIALRQIPTKEDVDSVINLAFGLINNAAHEIEQAMDLTHAGVVQPLSY